jgi:multicomponent Na+:H+ antiporter subunit E
MATLSNKNRLRLRSGALLFLLISAWLLWSGLYTALLLGLGALSCILSLYLAHRVGFFDEAFSLQVIPRLPRYWGWLLLEIARSSLDVTRIILHRRPPISPTVVDIEAAPRGPVGQAILGNSITLTPGTLTLDVHNGRIKVHCLTQAGADALISSEINSRAAALTED